MTPALFKELDANLEKLIDAGDESAARQYLVDHYIDFPLDVQDKIAFAFFTEAVDAAEEEDAVVSAVQEEGISIMRFLSQVKREIADAQRVNTLRAQLAA